MSSHITNTIHFNNYNYLWYYIFRFTKPFSANLNISILNLYLGLYKNQKMDFAFSKYLKTQHLIFWLKWLKRQQLPIQDTQVNLQENIM